MLDVDAVEARANAATPGPWEAGDVWVYTLPVYPDDNRLSDVLGMQFADDERAAAEHARGLTNAEFIAHAREDIPLLIGEVRRLRLALAGEQQVNGSARVARVRELEAAARVDYAALRVDVDNVSVSELVAAEARVVALAEAADVYEGVAL